MVCPSRTNNQRVIKGSRLLAILAATDLTGPNNQVLGGRCIVSRLYRKAGVEPPLNELMADEITLAVMRRDGLSPETVWAHVEQARASLRDRMVPMLRQCA